MRLCYRHSPAQGQIHRPRQPLGHPLTVGRCKMLALGDGVLVGRLLPDRSEEHTSELQSLAYLVCRLLLEKKKKHYNVGKSSLNSRLIHPNTSPRFNEPDHKIGSRKRERTDMSNYLLPVFCQSSCYAKQSS